MSEAQEFCKCQGEAYFSRIVPMGYYCQECGLEIENDSKEYTYKCPIHGLPVRSNGSGCEVCENLYNSTKLMNKENQ